jgi:hypothetical protein
MEQNESHFGHTVEVQIAAKDFKDFAVFDVFIRLRRWVPMALFTGILTLSAVVCFILHSRAENAVLLGTVLMVIGVGLPIAYIRQFYKSVAGQAKRMGLETPKRVYSLELAPFPENIIVTRANGQQETFAWGNMTGAYRRENAIYLYAESTKAYLLPRSCLAEGIDAEWDFLNKYLPKSKCFDCCH